ncbi:Oxoglutarate/iron-dependent dioxygenase [Gracilaria domingensis]|nr:Oxoglutarate/iron-dependent dioxygenase [Gracilaria domingensis]
MSDIDASDLDVSDLDAPDFDSPDSDTEDIEPPHHLLPNTAFPEELQSALQSVSEPFTPHIGGACDLPWPGLRVAQMDHPVAFPLSPTQAEQLAQLAAPCPHGRGLETVVDADVRDCMQIEPSALTLSNPKWEAAVTKLLTGIANAFGVPATAITASLYKLLLYRPGGHFKPHRDTEKEPGMFATLSIQLPSLFQGGEFVVTHKNKSTMYHGGVWDGSCEYSSHYTAFFADVEHQIRPVTKGYRIALVYNLTWLGNGCPPSAKGSNMSMVGRALSGHAKKFPSRAWYVAFGLEHKYTDASLSTMGVRALKGADRRYVSAISLASKEAGMGDVNVVLCKLSKTNQESGDGWYGTFDVQETDEGTPRVDEQYVGDGTLGKYELGFVDWDSALSNLDFEVTEEGEVEYTGNEGATRETTYGALAVVLWPKNKDLELICSCTNDISPLLRMVPKCVLHERIDRLLAHREALGPSDRNAWRHTRYILEVAGLNGENSHITRAMKFASMLSDTQGIEEVIRVILSRHGWAQCEQAVTEFLSHANMPELKTCESHIGILFIVLSRHNTSSKFSQDGLQVVLSFLEKNNGLTVQEEKPVSRTYFGLNSYGRGRKSSSPQWSMLLRIVEKVWALASAANEGTSVETLMTRLAAVISNLKHEELKELEQAMKMTYEHASPSSLAQIRTAISTRRRKLDLAQFLEVADDLIKNKCLSDPLFATHWHPCQDNQQESPRSFVDLACSYFSGDTVEDIARTKFDSALMVLPNLPQRDINLLIDGANNAQLVGMHEPTATRIKQAALSVQLSREEDSLRAQIQGLESATAIQPRNVPVRYPGSYGMTEVEVFMAGDKIETTVTGFGSVVVARKMLKGFQSSLPSGTHAVAGGTGKRSFISLRKPFYHERMLWLDYKKKMTELGAKRRQLTAVQQKRCMLDPSGSQRPAKRLKVEHQGHGVFNVAKTNSSVGVDGYAKKGRIIDSITID